MAERMSERQRLVHKLDYLNDAEIKELMDYVSIMETMRRAVAAGSHGAKDDIAELLAEREENKRARQAFAWEAVRRRDERRAATTLFHPPRV
ncbi:MAG: hypothetical protein WKF74_02050 [Pyrinomonadaceae bacterium]